MCNLKPKGWFTVTVEIKFCLSSVKRSCSVIYKVTNILNLTSIQYTLLWCEGLKPAVHKLNMGFSITSIYCGIYLLRKLSYTRLLAGSILSHLHSVFLASMSEPFESLLITEKVCPHHRLFVYLYRSRARQSHKGVLWPGGILWQPLKSKSVHLNEKKVSYFKLQNLIVLLRHAMQEWS